MPLFSLYSCSTRKEEFWRLSHHENPARMRLKLEPSLYHDPHTGAANLRDNTANTNDDRFANLIYLFILHNTKCTSR